VRAFPRWSGPVGEGAKRPRAIKREPRKDGAGWAVV
jgi:hypothetical protein